MLGINKISTAIFGFIVLSVLILTNCQDSKTDDASTKFVAKIENNSPNISSENSSQIKREGFYANLPEDFSIPNDAVGNKMLKDYGAIFLAKNGAILPTKIAFENEAEVIAWQNSISTSSENISGTPVELQTPAMNAFLEARKEAAAQGLTIAPRGTLGSKRSYTQTLKLWNSRFLPALSYWTQRGRISQKEADEIKKMPVIRQVERVLQWEKNNLFFSKDFQKSILNSVAVPGASQHNFLLALDIWEFGNPRVRQIMAKHGWFQTVKNDFPHFTYLGIEEKDLPCVGLKAYLNDGYKFWLVEIDSQ